MESSYCANIWFVPINYMEKLLWRDLIIVGKHFGLIWICLSCMVYIFKTEFHYDWVILNKKFIYATL